MCFSVFTPQSYTEIPPSHMVLIAKFWRTYSFKSVNSKYILIDPLDNKWTSPEVFNKQREVVEKGDLHKIDLKQYQLGLVYFGAEFKLTSSLRKMSYKDEIYPIHASQLADKDTCKMKDPDFIPDLD